MMDDNFDFADEVVAELIAFVADRIRSPAQEETEIVIATLSVMDVGFVQERLTCTPA